MWERWDSLWPDGAFQDPGMNSFNHYAYGSVGEWMYAHIAGIAPGRPGYARSSSARVPAAASARHGRHSPLYGGRSGTRWKHRHGRFELTCSLPANTTAQVWIPCIRHGPGPAHRRNTTAS
ncbi:alpha-L-rhamnosidase-related protein [Streptomyces albogriseolus]|uniref:alpha-L-rhamnosidase-related protein n=1 Tax=Streptomyces albogriseolus TaxID=1887 RepID=UPI00338E9066